MKNKDSKENKDIENLQEELIDEQIANIKQQMDTAATIESEPQTPPALEDDGFQAVINSPGKKDEITELPKEPEAAAQEQVSAEEISAEEPTIQDTAESEDIEDNSADGDAADENAEEELQDVIEAGEAEGIEEVGEAEQEETGDFYTDEQEGAPPSKDFAEEETQEWHDPFEDIDATIAVKKYVIYIARDFVQELDRLDTDARNAYVNDALQIKINLEKESEKTRILKKTFKHIAIVILTIIIGTPLLSGLVGLSIKLTNTNYEYMQKNFEELYKQRAEKDRIIRRANTSLDNRK